MAEPIEEQAADDAADPVVPETQQTDDVGKLRADLEAERAERTRQADELRELKGYLVGVAQSQHTQQTDEDDPTDEEFITQPKAAAQRLVRKALTQYSRVLAPHLENINERQFQSDVRAAEAVNPKVRSKVRKQVEQYFKDKPQERNNPGAAEAVYKYYVGENFESIMQELQADKQKEPTVGGPPTARQKDVTPEPPKFEDWELNSMKKFKMTPEEWLEAKKR